MHQVKRELDYSTNDIELTIEEHRNTVSWNVGMKVDNENLKDFFTKF